MVHHKLMQLPEEYHVIDDELFMSNGRSTRIDHIVVSPYAVFVIETKGYKGWILGGDNLEYWTQFIYKHKSTFYTSSNKCLSTTVAEISRLAASGMTSERGDSITSSVTIMLRRTGRQCMNCALFVTAM